MSLGVLAFLKLRTKLSKFFQLIFQTWFQIREQIVQLLVRKIYVIGITIFVEESNTAWVEIYPWEYQNTDLSLFLQCHNVSNIFK